MVSANPLTHKSQKPGSNGSAISQKNTNYIANLEFWSDNQAIKYDVANPSTYLKTEVKGSVSTTADATSAAGDDHMEDAVAKLANKYLGS